MLVYYNPYMTTGKTIALTRRWRRKWQPTPVFLPGESQGQRSLVGCCLWGTQSWTRLKRLSMHALTRWTFVHKVMALLFNMLSRLVIVFLPRSKCLLISWLQSQSPVIWEPKKIKSATVSPPICHEVMGPDAMI